LSNLLKHSNNHEEKYEPYAWSVFWKRQPLLSSFSSARIAFEERINPGAPALFVTLDNADSMTID